MEYKTFEHIQVWQDTRNLVGELFRLTRVNMQLKKDLATCDQLRRAILSVLLNIAEGFERGTNREFANFLNIAKGSAGEVRAILYILFDLGYVKEAEFVSLRKRIEGVSKQLSNFRSYLLSKSTK